MFLSIFSYELKYWFKNPAVYIYSTVFFLMATGIMAANAGIFGEESVSSPRISNSPMNIYMLSIFFNKLMLLLLPAIIGNAVYRDFSHNTFTVLYSYPFTKAAYLSGKFLSAFLVIVLISSMVALGFFVGTQLAGVDKSLIAPFSFNVYLHSYLVYLIPNLLLFGVIVFAIVTVSRNIYAGFIGVFILLILREAVSRLMGGTNSNIVALLMEPFGEAATNFYTRNQTFAEQNKSPIPFEVAIIYNRFFWLAIAVFVFGMLYKWFSFNQQAFTFAMKSNAQECNTKSNFGSIIKVKLPKVNFRFEFFHQLKASWRLSRTDFKYILTSGSFISVLIVASLFTFILLLQMNPQYETRIVPVTWVMLAFPVFFFSIFINLITFLYAGVLVHRAKTSRMNELVDATATENRTLLFSKFFALLKLQTLLLFMIMLSGIIVQAYNGYYHFEIGHYLFDLYGIHLIGFVIWAFAALFIQTAFTNFYLGLFLLVLFSLGMTELPQLGIERIIFRFNQNPEPDFFLKYSDLSGYGHSLIPYFIYKLYWVLFGLLLFFCTILFWSRGLMESFKERLSIAVSRFRGRLTFAVITFLILFLAMGSWIYKKESTADKILTEQETNRIIAKADKKYAAYTKTIQPRIVKVKVDMNIFPESLSFAASGIYLLKNKSNKIIDTLLINYAFDVKTQYRINGEFKMVSRDTIAHFDMLHLNNGVEPGDSLELSFEVQNIPNTLLYKNSMVEKDGTFITSAIFPGLGYRSANSGASPSDSSALRNHYRSIDADRIDFEATVSTSEDQIAIAPGYLQKEWNKKSRRYFYYKSEGKVTNDYVFNSGCYEVERDVWKNINLEIYYHKGHDYNLKHLMHGMKAALTYNEKYFSPYQHRQARIIEYSRTQGNFAQSFANTIPSSEVNFILKTDAVEYGALNLPFLGAAHELAHQWWGHQVTPADVLGCRMITESMAEYVSLKVLEQGYGKDKVRLFLKRALDIYLRKRVDDADGEKPLMYNTGLDHSYIPYQKGSLAMYVMSEYIGEEQLNRALKTYLDKVKFQNAPYTTSIEMVNYIRAFTPDSLQYLITDLFETVTLYDNKILSSKVKHLSNGKYAVEVEFLVIKYRIDERGEKVYANPYGQSITYKASESVTPVISLPLAECIEIGALTKNDKNGNRPDEKHFIEKSKVSGIYNKVTIIIDSEPSAVTIDPYMKLIDENQDDNTEII